MRFILALALAFALTPALAVAKGGKGKDAKSVNVSSYWCAGHSQNSLCKH